VIDEVLTQQHGVGLGVDVRGERDRVGAVVDEDDLPRAAYTIARGRDGDEPGPYRLADAFDGEEPRVALGVARRDLIRRDRNAGVGGDRRGDVHDGVSSHADGEQPVVSGRELTEPLPEQHRSAGAERRAVPPSQRSCI
jgi:hypothetical protein